MSERFILELQPEGDGPPGVIRLRRLLKCALRSFGLRCVSVSEAPQSDSETFPASPPTSGPSEAGKALLSVCNASVTSAQIGRNNERTV